MLDLNATRRLVVLSAVVFIAGVAVAGVTATSKAETGTKTIQCGSITGTLGHRGSIAGMGEYLAGAKYGHVATGRTCQCTQAKITQANNLEVKLVWDGSGDTDHAVDATASLKSVTYQEAFQADDNCPAPINGTYIGTSKITLNKPGTGTGGGSGTAGVHSANIGQGNQSGTDQQGSMAQYTWEKDASDPDDYTLFVTAKVTCEGEDVKQVSSDHQGEARLQVTITAVGE